jgi:iron-sulfur cluster assembly protein
LALRVGVKTVGCSGLAYTYALADELDGGDVVFEAHAAKLVIDPKSLAMIDGARLDFVTEGHKQSFQFDNPNADSTCGCGESFNLKASAPAGVYGLRRTQPMRPHRRRSGCARIAPSARC